MYIKSIGKYGTALDCAKADQHGEEALELVRAWRKKLDGKSELLDKYVSGIVTAISGAVCVTNTAEAGFVEAFSELRRLCRQIREGKENETRNHPFYPTIKSYMNTHTIPEDGIYYEVFCAGLFKEFSVFAAARFVEDCDARINDYLEERNIPAIREMLIGAEAELSAANLDHLHDLVMRFFIRVSPSAIFMQGMIEQVSASLISRDGQSGEYVFHRLLDNRL